jgi:hypothetical protein
MKDREAHSTFLSWDAHEPGSAQLRGRTNPHPGVVRKLGLLHRDRGRSSPSSVVVIIRGRYSSEEPLNSLVEPHFDPARDGPGRRPAASSSAGQNSPRTKSVGTTAPENGEPLAEIARRATMSAIAQSQDSQANGENLRLDTPAAEI